MKYMGSKARLSKYIIPIMEAYREPGQVWVEPFVGGGNSIDKVCNPRLGGDANKWAVDALVSIRDNPDDLPKDGTEFTEEMYRSLRNSDEYRHKGYASFALSYGGKFMGGWRRDRLGKRDYVAESYRNAQKQSPKLSGCALVVSDYFDLVIPDNSLIYCDPPYKGTTSYKVGRGFDYGRFEGWCRAKSEQGHTVFVSSYEAPVDFECVWEYSVNSSLTKNTGGKRAVERLFLAP